MIALDTDILARFYVDDPGDPEAAKQRPIAYEVFTTSPSLFVPLRPQDSYADTLWKSADALRGQVDAAEYKHVVLGPALPEVHLRCLRGPARGTQGRAEADGITGPQIESLLENRDEYTAERVFWVPPEARWQNLQNQATGPTSPR
jgi:hypothetical protein